MVIMVMMVMVMMMVMVVMMMAMLMVVMNHYHHLHDPPSLCLPYVADDSLLCKLGSGVCPSLKHLDVQVASLTLIGVVMTNNMILTEAIMIIITSMLIMTIIDMMTMMLTMLISPGQLGGDQSRSGWTGW